MTKENVDHKDAMRLMLTLSPRFGLYQPSLTLAIIKEWIKIPSPTGFISPRDPMFLVQFNNNFQLMPTLTANVRFDFTSCGDMENVSLVKPAYRLDIGATKTFLNDRLSIRLAGVNLLDSQEHVKLRFGSRTLRQNMRRDSREVEFTVRYKFNAAQSKYKGTGAGASEKERL